MANSRLKKHLKNQAVKNIILAIGGVFLILLLLIIFGSKILIGFSILAGKMNKDTVSNTTSQKSSYIEPPTLDTTIDATNSATTTITGTGLPHQTIRLYKNDDFIQETQVKDDNTFIFRDVSLADGNNAFKAKAQTDANNQSEYSNLISILHSKKQPTLTITSPSDGQTFKKEQTPIQVTGTTDTGVKVTVNDFWAIVSDSGSFSYSYNLHDGDNTLTLLATDPSGNTTSKEVKIHVE